MKERINQSLVYLFFVSLYLILRGFPDAACPYPGNPDTVKPGTENPVMVNPDVALVFADAAVHSLFSGNDELFWHS